MISRRCESAWDDRRGFTMVEVLLTLCLLAAMAAISWPSLKNTFANQRLRAAANRVRAQWLQARCEAMTSNAVYAFRYSFGGSQFYIESRPDPDAFAEESLGDGMGGSAGADDPSTRLRRFEGILPDGVIFAASQIAPDVRAATLAAGSDPGSQSQDEMEPILFYPDGTASTAQLRLQNERGACVELSMRGLTGVITVGGVSLGAEPLR